MKYYLMNKDHIIAAGKMEPGIEESIRLEEVYGTLPIGMGSATAWIENRKASKHNHHLKKIMEECGCDTLEGFVDVTHAASINDTFWVKKEADPSEWKDVSLYTNDFNETISKLAFYGLGIADIELSSTSPELVTGGTFPKCLKKERDRIYLYKRGHTHTYNGGLEPYGEVMAGEMAGKLCQKAVKYDLVNLHGTMASKCRLFTGEKYGYVPMSAIAPNGLSVDDLYRYMERFDDGSEERFREMLVCDAVTFNQDRHAGNFGVIIDNDTVAPLGMAPVFDFNLAFLPYVLDEEFESIGDKLLDYSPKLGEDFTRIGQQAMTDTIRDRLIDLKDFEFSFHGDCKFSKGRLDTIRGIINRQINAVLSKDILYTKDVFIPYRQIEKDKKTKAAKERLDRAYPSLEQIADKESFFISITEDENSQTIYIEPDMPDGPTLCIDFMANEITAEKDGQVISLSSLDGKYLRFIDTADRYMHNCNDRISFTVLAGIPGSGKQAKALEMCKDMPGAVYIRTNDIRMELGDVDQDKVFSEAHSRIKNALQNRQSVIYVATNLDRDTRKNLIDLTDSTKNIDKKLVVMYCAPDKADSNEPKQMLYNKAVKLHNNRPEKDEGWDEIDFIGNDPYLDRGIIKEIHRREPEQMASYEAKEK